jgi:hypothetical protein
LIHCLQLHELYPSLQTWEQQLGHVDSNPHNKKTPPRIGRSIQLPRNSNGPQLSQEDRRESSPISGPLMQAPRLVCSPPHSNFKGPAPPLAILSLNSNALALITTIASFVPAVARRTIPRFGEPAWFPLVGSRKKVDERSTSSP